jgi:hypothetical protein
MKLYRVTCQHGLPSVAWFAMWIVARLESFLGLDGFVQILEVAESIRALRAIPMPILSIGLDLYQVR